MREIFVPTQPEIKQTLAPVNTEELPVNAGAANSSVEFLLQSKEKYNSDPDLSNVLVDPCEINLNLIRKDCEFKTNDSSLCELGVLMKNGIPACILNPQRQLTLRSTFASKER